MSPLPSRILRTLPAFFAGTLAIGCLLTAELRVPGVHGADRITRGFRLGRWDARFLVARGPAAVCVPAAARATVLLSGPARLTVHTPEGQQSALLETGPVPVPVVLGQRGCASLEADRPIRIHEAQLIRTGAVPLWRLAVLLLFAAAGVALAFLGHGLQAWLASSALSLCALFALVGTWGGLVLAVGLERLAPALAILALGALFFVVGILPAAARSSRGNGPSSGTPGDRGSGLAPRYDLPMVLGGLTLASCFAQVLWLPQPLLIGDPAAYHDMGGRFLSALRVVRGPEDLGEALLTLKPYGGLAATGLLYGLLRGIHDDLGTLYVVHSLTMAAAVGFLVRAAVRLGGRRLGFITGALALLYPTFPVICGIVQPEPVILLAWTFALDHLLAALETRNLRGVGVSGTAFGLGLALHPQGLWFLLAALVLALFPFLRRLSSPAVRHSVLAFALGVLPVAVVTAAGERYARPAVHVLEERYGFWAYTATHPLGFWLFIDSDGWQGPLHLEQTRYVKGLRNAEAEGWAKDAPGRLFYTAGFVAENFGASVRAVLRNLHRLFHVPDNPFRRDWILPYGLQVYWHRVLVVLFLLSAPLAISGRGAVLLLPFAMLAATYPLYHIFNKYAVPVTPFLLLGAALALERLATRRPPMLLAALGAAAAGAFLTPASLAQSGIPVALALVVVRLLHWGGLAAAFLLAARDWAGDVVQRRVVAIAGVVSIVPALAAAWGDPSWRFFWRALDRPARYETTLDQGGVARLDAAREAFLLLDLQASRGSLDDLRLEFDTGLVLSGSDLTPTMPSFGLATLRGGRDARSFRQWWKTPWRSDMTRDGRLGVTVSGSAGVRLAGDLGTPRADGTLDSLSLGQWPHLSVYRLMHEGEYRLAHRETLESREWRSEWNGRTLRGSWRIRAVPLDDDAGGAVWETAPAPGARVVTGIWARAGRSGRAELQLPAGSMLVELDRPGTYSGPAGEVRVFRTAEDEGWFMVKLRATRGLPLRLAVRPLLEMSAVPKFFRPELRPLAPPFPLDWAGLPQAPAVRVLEARDTPPWRPAAVY